jgi:hypothetical protein
MIRSPVGFKTRERSSLTFHKTGISADEFERGVSIKEGNSSDGFDLMSVLPRGPAAEAARRELHMAVDESRTG